MNTIRVVPKRTEKPKLHKTWARYHQKYIGRYYYSKGFNLCYKVISLDAVYKFLILAGKNSTIRVDEKLTVPHWERVPRIKGMIETGR